MSVPLTNVPDHRIYLVAQVFCQHRLGCLGTAKVSPMCCGLVSNGQSILDYKATRLPVSDQDATVLTTSGTAGCRMKVAARLLAQP
jgi:hypothetical protein